MSEIRVLARKAALLSSLLLLLSALHCSPTVIFQHRPKYERFLTAPLSEIDGDGTQKDRPTTFLLAIFTRSNDLRDRKEYVRDTYIKGAIQSDERFCKLDEFVRQTSESSILENRLCQVPYTFVIGGGGKHKPYDHDNDSPVTMKTDRYGHVDPEGDCTYLNIQENMNFGKSPTYFKFGAEMSKEYAIDYIAKLDDDTMISIDLLLEFINDELPPAPYNRRIYGGAVRLSRLQSHMYAAGEFYFMSSDLADYVSSLTAEGRNEFMVNRRTEDLDMGTFIYSHPMPIKFINLYPRMFWHHPCKSEQCFRTFWEESMSSLGEKERPVMPWTHYCKTILNGRQL